MQGLMSKEETYFNLFLPSSVHVKDDKIRTLEDQLQGHYSKASDAKEELQVLHFTKLFYSGIKDSNPLTIEIGNNETGKPKLNYLCIDWL